MAILNRYKKIFDNLINSSDTESLDWSNFLDQPGLIDKGLYNMPRSRGGSPTFLQENHFDKNISIILLELVSII